MIGIRGGGIKERSVKSELCGEVEIRMPRTRSSEFRSRILGKKWERCAFFDGVILMRLKADEARGNVENAEILIVMWINEGFMERKVRNREMIAEMGRRLEKEGKEEGQIKKEREKVGGYVQYGMEKTAWPSSFLRYNSYRKEHE